MFSYKQSNIVKGLTMIENWLFTTNKHLNCDPFNTKLFLELIALQRTFNFVDPLNNEILEKLYLTNFMNLQYWYT